MQVALDTYDHTTVYADLREEETLTDGLRGRAVARARQLGAQHVEFWRPPHGQGPDRMEGFVELARVDPASQTGRGAVNDAAPAHNAMSPSSPRRPKRRQTKFDPS